MNSNDQEFKNFYEKVLQKAYETQSEYKKLSPENQTRIAKDLQCVLHCKNLADAI